MIPVISNCLSRNLAYFKNSKCKVRFTNLFFVQHYYAQINFKQKNQVCSSIWLHDSESSACITHFAQHLDHWATAAVASKTFYIVMFMHYIIIVMLYTTPGNEYLILFEVFNGYTCRVMLAFRYGLAFGWGSFAIVPKVGFSYDSEKSCLTLKWLKLDFACWYKVTQKSRWSIGFVWIMYIHRLLYYIAISLYTIEGDLFELTSPLHSSMHCDEASLHVALRMPTNLIIIHAALAWHDYCHICIAKQW